MGLSGQIGAGAVGALDEILAQQLLQKKFEEAQRQAQVEEAQRAQQIGQTDARLGLDRDTFTANQSHQEAMDQQAAINDMRAQQAAERERQDKLETQSQLEGFAQRMAGAKPSQKVAADIFRISGGRAIPDPGHWTSPEEDRAVLSGQMERDRARQQAELQFSERMLRNQGQGVGGLTPPQERASSRIEDDYARDSKPYLTIRDAHQRIKASADNAAGDMSMIFGFMKILDPNSVVRETEYANAQNAAGVPDQIRNIYNQVLQGRRLNPEQRKQFSAQADGYMKAANENQRQVVRRYEHRAKVRGIPVDYIISPDEIPNDEALTAPPPGAVPSGAADPSMDPDYQKFVLGKK